MPHLPKWMADGLEHLLSSKYFDAEVTATTFINPEILQITFRADLLNMEFYPGWALMLRAGANDLRHYTMSSFNRESGLFEILFHIHGGGPGSDLAAGLKVGEKLKMALPSGPKMLVSGRDHHFFFGDETSLSFVLILVEEIKKNGGAYQGIMELRAQNSQVPDQLNMDLKTVLSTPDTPGLQAISYLQALKDKQDDLPEKYVFYLTGNVSSVQLFRKELKKLGVSSQNIRFQGYWVEGSIGL
jgi:NADPH-dependent ferric siderophore reductase